MGKLKNLLSKTKQSEKPAQEPAVILKSWSPVCDIQAFVEKSTTAFYFYLWVNPASDNPVMMPCWICNRIKAEDKIDYDAMDKGSAPMMPSSYVKHDLSGIDIDANSLSIVWSQEGDGATLLENDKIICEIPFWADRNFYGYSRYAEGTGPFAWTMDEAYETLNKKVIRDKEYWTFLDTDYFSNLQESRLSSMEDFFGEYEKYYAIDNNNFPPKALVTGRKNDVSYAFTLGVSALCQPKIEQYFEDDEYLTFRRIELAFACSDDFKNSSEYIKMLSYVSGQTNLPWRALTWLGNGHTIPCNAISGFTGVLLLNSAIYDDLDSPLYKNFMDEKINNLWLVPLTAEEYEFAQNHSLNELLSIYNGCLNDLVVFNGHAKFL